MRSNIISFGSGVLLWPAVFWLKPGSILLSGVIIILLSMAGTAMSLTFGQKTVIPSTWWQEFRLFASGVFVCEFGIGAIDYLVNRSNYHEPMLLVVVVGVLMFMGVALVGGISIYATHLIIHRKTRHPDGSF